MKYVKNFNELAADWAKKYEEYCKKNKGRFSYSRQENKIAVIDWKKKKTAFATCKKGEEFSYRIGVGVAFARLMGEEIPSEYPELLKLLSELKGGEKFILFDNSNVYFWFIGKNKDGFYVAERENGLIAKMNNQMVLLVK